MLAKRSARLRSQLESFLKDSQGFEGVWLLSEILSDYESTYSDLGVAISANVDKYDTYGRVYWRNADKVRDFGILKWALPQIPCSFKENASALAEDPCWVRKEELCSAGVHI